jgi:hypothetical protein
MTTSTANWGEDRNIDDRKIKPRSETHFSVINVSVFLFARQLNPVNRVFH